MGRPVEELTRPLSGELTCWPSAVRRGQTAWAKQTADVDGLILIGSRARSSPPADQFADIDLLLVTSTPSRYLYGNDWLEQWGDVQVSVVERAPVGSLVERRLLLVDGQDVDVVVTDRSSLARALVTPQGTSVVGGGARVLHDGLVTSLCLFPTNTGVRPRRPRHCFEATTAAAYVGEWLRGRPPACRKS